ncbi:MAG TPA: YoaK family protein [Acidimicrobiia bacterium]|nr:YoaK family protein [Acidimicrobiia bacterium]
MADATVAVRPRLAILLAGVGGWVDAIGFLTLFGLFTAHLSGNTARLGVAIGRGEASTALTYAVPIVVFFAGAVVGVAFMTDRGARGHRAVGPLLAVEAALVAAFMFAGTILRDAGDLTPRSASYYAVAVLAVAAMGLQTAAIRNVAGVPVHTTFITGMVTHFAEAIVGVARRDRGDARSRAGIYGSLVGSYIVGAASGAALEGVWALWALSVPVVVLIGLSVATRGEPA